nr:DUF1295 domain-containing protein [Parabacteroides pacaensis]
MEAFNIFLVVMASIALFIFIALYFINAGYGMLFDKKWGITLPSKIGWSIMEMVVFFIMFILWFFSSRKLEIVPFLFFIFFELHYFQRSFIYPLLMKGNSRMPIGIMSMAILFNILNGYMQGEWIFYLAPADLYTKHWLQTPQFISGTAIFFLGMFINIQSDHVIRNLRKPGDTNHYLPQKGLYKYVTSANYLGEIIEWTGFAILTWSWSGLVFAWWTFANLVPRANALYHKYEKMFGKEKVGTRKRIFPFIY